MDGTAAPFHAFAHYCQIQDKVPRSHVLAGLVWFGTRNLDSCPRGQCDEMSKLDERKQPALPEQTEFLNKGFLPVPR